MDTGETWRTLRNREVIAWLCKVVEVTAVCLVVARCRDAVTVVALVTGFAGALMAHWWMDRVQCPRCHRSFVNAGWTKPYWALVVSPTKCANCGLRRGAETWLPVEEEEKRREQMRREIRRERKRVLVSRSKE